MIPNFDRSLLQESRSGIENMERCNVKSTLHISASAGTERSKRNTCPTEEGMVPPSSILVHLNP